MKRSPLKLSKYVLLLLFLLPLLVGGAVLGWAISQRQDPQQQPPRELAMSVVVAEVQQHDIQPRVTGYGLAQPARTWTAIARVPGAIVETHDHLKSGNYVKQGEVLLRIDPEDYQIALDQHHAEAQAIRAQIAEVERTRANSEASLEVEKRSLELARRDYQRNKDLTVTGAVSASEADSIERAVLAQQSIIQQLENSLGLIEPQIQRLNANLQSVEQRRRSAELDLQRTTLTAPFDCRLAEVNIEPGQYVATNQQLFEVHGTAATEVEARIPLDDLTVLAALALRSESANPPTQELPAASLNSLVQGLDATVRVRSGEWSRSWPAQIVRIREGIERRTRSVGVVVRVDHQQARTSEPETPLLAEMFCEVELTGRTWHNQLLVPRGAMRDGYVLVVGKDNRLQRREVERLFDHDEFVCVRGELGPGEQVVSIDPGVAVEGALVHAVQAMPASDSQPAEVPVAEQVSESVSASEETHE